MHLDLETYSECPISEAGAWKYSKHPSTDVWCAAYSDGDEIKIWIPGKQPPKAPKLVYAWNAGFEYAIWKNILTPRYGWPAVPFDRFRCVQAAALTRGSPFRLDYACEYFKVGISKADNKTMHRLAKPDKHGNRPETTVEELVLLYNYCKQDVKAEQAIAKVVGDMSPTELKVFQLDHDINRRGIPIDVEFAKVALEVWDTYAADRIKAFGEITGLKPTQTVKFRDWLGQQDVEGVGSVDKASVARILKQDIPPLARRALELRQEVGGTSLKKFNKAISGADDDDRMRGTLQYHAAHTGRWGGRMYQPQNLPRGCVQPDDVEAAYNLVRTKQTDTIKYLWGDVNEVLGSMTRPIIRAKPGCRLISADFAGVEARALAWLAGQDDLVEAFNSGTDTYVDMAKKIYPGQNITKEMRAVGKMATLGCGYGMGPDRFKAQILQQHGVKVSEKVARDAVYAYRDTYTKIPALWKALERKFRKAIVNHGGPHEVVPGKMWAVPEPPWVSMRLPSGRSVHYLDPEVVQASEGTTKLHQGDNICVTTVDSQSGRPYRQEIWGGFICENVIQAICRDLLVNGMFNLRSAGYNIIFTVHDEVICEEENSFGSVEEVCNLLCQKPDWAEGLPLVAEGFESPFFRKD